MPPADIYKAMDTMFQNLAARSSESDSQMQTTVADSERIMRKPARQLLEATGLLSLAASDDGPDTVAAAGEPFALLDHACGTGPVAAALLDARDAAGVVQRSRVLCADFSEALVGTLRQRIAVSGWDGVETAVLDAQKTDLLSASFSHITLNFAMHIIPSPDLVLADAHRLLRPGGALGFTVWDAASPGVVPDLRSAFASLPFATPPLPDPFPMAMHGKPEWVSEAGLTGEIDRFNKAVGSEAFVDFEVHTHTQAVHVDGPEHFLRMFSFMIHWGTATFWDEATRSRANEGGLLERHIVEHVREKYGGRGWDQEWTYLVASCKKAL